MGLVVVVAGDGLRVGGGSDKGEGNAAGRPDQGEREILDGVLIGESVVLAGLFGDQGPQGRVGGEGSVIPVPMDPGQREDLGEAIESERRLRTIPNQPLEVSAVGGFDAGAGVEAVPRRPPGIEELRGVRRAREPKRSNPPPWSHVSMSSVSWGSGRTWRRTRLRTVCWRGSRSCSVRAVASESVRFSV